MNVAEVNIQNLEFCNPQTSTSSHHRRASLADRNGREALKTADAEPPELQDTRCPGSEQQ